MEAEKMLLEKEGNGGKIVMVVLDGVKVSTEKNGGTGPLRYALRDLLVQKDEVLVLAILNARAPTPSPAMNGGYCCLRENKNCHSLAGDNGDTYINFLNGEINRKTQAYMNIFRPFYDECKSNSVKFLVKIAAGYQTKAIIVDEANYAGAKWIVMDRCFADDDNSFQLSGINCDATSLVLVSDAEGFVLHNFVPPNNPSEASIVSEVECNQRYSKLKEKEETNFYCSLPNLEAENKPFLSYDHASTSRQGENLTRPEALQDSEISEMMVNDNSAYIEFSEVNDALGWSLEVRSWEVISEITSEFKNIICDEQDESFEMFKGYLPALQSEVLVKTHTGDFNGILKAEKTVASSMHHKHILGLIGYHQNADAISLIFPYSTKGTLERFLYGSRGQHWQLTFHDKMNIAIGIGQGLRYMHEECPQGPVIHGNLRVSNIFLKYNLQPQITSFGHAVWLQREQSSPSFSNRCWHKYHSDPELLKLIKADVLSFGILLLRLVCKKSIPQDNRMLIKWAQPLLSDRAYHEMLDEEEEFPDMYRIFRLMCAAAQCIKARHTARPSMTEVVSFLKGETSCNAQASPMLSDSSSSNHNYQNQTGPDGSTGSFGNRSLIRPVPS